MASRITSLTNGMYDLQERTQLITGHLPWNQRAYYTEQVEARCCKHVVPSSIANHSRVTTMKCLALHIAPISVLRESWCSNYENTPHIRWKSETGCCYDPSSIMMDFFRIPAWPCVVAQETAIFQQFWNWSRLRVTANWGRTFDSWPWESSTHSSSLTSANVL